jgi:anti-sigma factor RsiW
MTDPFATCERWDEPISLLAAGCLPAEEEADVRQHLAHCAACAARAAELTAVCASLSRSRPSAAVHTAAVCERWNAAAEGVLPRRPVRHTPSLGFWLSGALAASLLIAAVWLVHRQPGGSPPGPQEPRVAVGGAKSRAEQPPLPSDLPLPVEKVPVERVWSQPTLRAYELALAQSDEAFEALLQRHGESIVFEPYDPQSLLKESYR